MDIFRRQKFNEAMFAKNRTLAIRVGTYQSSDIKEASFDYGYIKGDTYKPGGTCAGSGKITFTKIVTTFNKLDKIYPEIGLLVDGTYEWVKMGEYFINNIEIDRNRNTTTLDLMDGMFKLNREYVTDLTFPAEIRQVIKEICLKTGITLANENMGLESMNYAIETKPKDKNKTFRDILSLATQMLGMSCFFNREGKLEIKELTDSGIVITADNYFLHGLTRSEVEYQIAGITCKKDKEGLTVGTRTGRSLEIENPFMTQSILDNLYHKIKDIRYYPFSLNYQGHLLLDVGQWVTIKTNKGETFKAPVLSQSFNFKGGLRSRISADSKAGNDTQYSYAGTITKKIEQFSEFEKQLQDQIKEADRGFDAKVDQIKKDFNDQIELAKAKAEENKKALSDEIDRRFHEFSPEGFEEAKNKAEEALKKAGTSAELVEQVKGLVDTTSENLDEFRTQVYNNFITENLFYGGLSSTKTELKKYVKEETDEKTSAIRETITNDFVAKSTYLENVEGINQRFESLKRDNEAKLADYKQGIDGRFANIASQMAGKVNDVDFQRVKETAQLYERIFGNTQNGVADNISRMVMTNQIFQTEVKKYTEDNSNLVFDPTNFSKWQKKQSDANIVEVQADTRLLRITNSGRNQPVYHGFKLPLTTSSFRQGEKLSYRMEAWVDVLPDAPLGIELWAEDGGVIASDRVTFTKTGIQVITGTMTVNKTTTKSRGFPLEFWLLKNGTVAIGKVSFIRGETPPQEFKDDTSAQDLVTQTKVSQLFDSYAIQTLTNAGAIASQINTSANNILIEAAKIRLKGKTLADEITAIDGYFKRLFVGDARIGTLNTDIIRSNSIAADKLIFDTALAKKLVASDVFTDTLAAKTAFINKLRSVVVSATLLEGYKGKIGGFQIGTHDKDPNSFWLTGQNRFNVGMGSGSGKWGQTALWVNWGDNWEKPGNAAWYVKNNGEMYCYNQAHFWGTPFIHGNLKVSGNIFYISDDDTRQGGYWIHSPSFKRIQEHTGYIYLYHFDDSYSWIPINKEISDRRYKHNIEDSKVSALDVVDKLKTYSYRKEYDDKVEDITCGIMAQDVQKYAPEAFFENPDGAYSYNTFALVPYLIKAIQELNQKVERLEQKT